MLGRLISNSRSSGIQAADRHPMLCAVCDPVLYHDSAHVAYSSYRSYSAYSSCEREIARRLNIAHSTFQAYKLQFPDFSNRLKKGRELADIKIENALFRAAIGYETEEIRTEFSDSSRIKSKKVTKITRKVPGDVIAQIFWLKNRCPDKWHDRREIKKK